MNDVLNVNNPRTRISGKQYTRSAAAHLLTIARNGLGLPITFYAPLACTQAPLPSERNNFFEGRGRLYTGKRTYPQALAQVSRSSLASRLPSLAWKTRKTNACFAGEQSHLNGLTLF